MNRSATAPSPSPRTERPACGYRNHWSTSPTPHTADTCSPARRCSLIVLMSGGPASPAASPSRTRSPAHPGGAAAPSPPLGHARQPLSRLSACRTRTSILGCPGRSWVSTLMTDTWQCGASTRTATRSADRSASISTSSGSSARRDAQVRQAITRLLRYAMRHNISSIAVEDLDFADARAVGRETMGRGFRGKRFRRTVAGIPTAVFRNRIAAQTYRHNVRLYAANPAYTSAWGDQHWRAPYENVTRHEAAATVIGRRAQGHKARRREGVTRTRPEDRVVRATDQATPDDRQASTRNRHRPGTRGTEYRPPSRASTRHLGRATVTPATANYVSNG